MTSGLVIIIILFALILFAAGIIFWSTLNSVVDLFNHATRYRFKHLWYSVFSKQGLNIHQREILLKNFTYYQKLDAENKWLFERRVRTFMGMKEFIVRTDEFELTEEMKVMISACAVQLSFGFPGIFFRHFYRILIYPDDYYSTITKKYHQGEVNRGGIIVLSWKNFLLGYMEENDGRNLGLHEMAHALLLEDAIMNGEFEFLDGEALEMWEELVVHEMILIQNGNSIFRRYGASNRHELFAVAVEVYFEQPLQMKQYSPRLYATMSKLLNQDILALAPVSQAHL